MAKVRAESRIKRKEISEKTDLEVVFAYQTDLDVHQDALSVGGGPPAIPVDILHTHARGQTALDARRTV